MHRQRDDYYETAQVCLNGHVVTSGIETSPESVSDFCGICGQPTIIKCRSCDKPIRGYHNLRNVVLAGAYIPPKFCYGCGKPFPWIETRLEAAKEMTELLDGLNSEEKAIIKQSFEDLVQDSPKSEVAAIKIKKTLQKLGKVAKEPLYKFAVDVASETAKKILLGGSGGANGNDSG